VQPGDTLSLIALRYYGDSNRWTAILEANPESLSDANALVPGMTLIIPR